MKPVKELERFGSDGIMYEGQELSYEDMRELGVSAYDALGQKIMRVVSVRSVKKGIVVKIIAMVQDPEDKTKERKGVVSGCDKCCGSDRGEVAHFSAHVIGGGIFEPEFMDKINAKRREARKIEYAPL